MEPKKISFGFSKITKKQNLLPIKTTNSEPEKELIKCLEGQEIMLVEERKETAPIIIPMTENEKPLASLMKRRAVLLGEEREKAAKASANQEKSKPIEIIKTNESSMDDLEKRAVREILLELQKTEETVRDSGLILPILKPDELPLDGAKESNLDDYDSIPIEQFGLAMLRGMGWVEPPPSEKKKLADEEPMVRPKGMGLGADKALKAKPLLVQPEANETLEIKKQAFVRILGGKFKDAYGQIEGFDDEAGRVIVKMAIGGTKEAFNEFLCQPVSKKEYSQFGKCINTAKYEEYKKLENEYGQIVVKQEPQWKIKPESKHEKGNKEFLRKESGQSSGKYSSEKPSSKRYDQNTISNSNRRRTRSKTRSASSSMKYNSSRKHNEETYSDDKSGSSANESDTDSEYKHRHKHRSKSKSSKEESQKSKKKSKKHRTKSGDSSCSEEDSKELDSQRDSSNKKNKKKTKKSKKKRSRTPSKRRK